MGKSTKEIIEAIETAMPASCRNVYKKAMKGRSLRAAVNAKRLDCSNWQKNEIDLCPVVGCPLYPYKPYPTKQTQKARKEKV